MSKFSTGANKLSRNNYGFKRACTHKVNKTFWISCDFFHPFFRCSWCREQHLHACNSCSDLSTELKLPWSQSLLRDGKRRGNRNVKSDELRMDLPARGCSSWLHSWGHRWKRMGGRALSDPLHRLLWRRWRSRPAPTERWDRSRRRAPPGTTAAASPPWASPARHPSSCRLPAPAPPRPEDHVHERC